MIKIPNYVLHSFLLVVLFLLSACSCGCVQNISIPDVKSLYETNQSQVTVFADGCGDADGSVDSEGVTSLVCSTAGTNGYINQGHWVKVPKISATTHSKIDIDIYGSVYYCSTGYDIKNPSPYFIANPAQEKSTLFADGSEMVLTPGQSIVVVDSKLSNGATIGTNSSVPTCSNDATGYQQFVIGQCKGTNILGLTIYSSDKELVTLDSTTNTIDPESQFNYFKSRVPDLFAFVDSADLNGYTDITGIVRPGILEEYNTTNQTSLNPAYGLGKYIFIVPEDASGKLGFSLAQGSGYTQGDGIGNYTLNILSTPPACFVDSAKASEQPGKRGALQMYIGNSNPNYLQSITSDFDNLAANEIGIYYPQLLQYIAQVSGITINSNADILSDLVVTPLIESMVIDEATLSATPYNSGDIWFLVRDDYYHDNVGQYLVNISITRKLDSQVSNFLQSLIDPVTDELNKYTRLLYSAFYKDTNFIKIVRVFLLLYIVLLGCEYTLGLNKIKASDLFIRVVKIAVVTMVLDPQSWNFFNDYLFSLFTTGNEYLIASVVGDDSPDKVHVFGFVDDAFNVFFQYNTWLRLAAVMLSMVGIICLPILIYVIISYLFIMARVLVSYMLCIAMISILLSIAPIFIVMILFSRTKKFFDNWIKSLFEYTMYSALLFLVFYFISTIFVEMWIAIISYDICWGGVIPLYVDFNTLLNTGSNIIPKLDIGCVQWFRPVEGAALLYSLLVQSLLLIVMVGVLRGFVGHVAEISSEITGIRGGGADGIESTIFSVEGDVKSALGVQGGSDENKSAAQDAMRRSRDGRGKQ